LKTIGIPGVSGLLYAVDGSVRFCGGGDRSLLTLLLLRLRGPLSVAMRGQLGLEL
jgi:hypothetical protein